MAEWRAGKRDDAIAKWNAELKKNGKSYEAHVDLAVAELGHKQTADVELHASSALAVKPGPLPYVVLALAALEDDRKPAFELARMLITQAEQIDPKSAAAMAARGLLAIRENDWTLAHDAFARAAALAPGDESIQLAAAITALYVGQADAASKLLANVKAKSYEAFVARGVAAHELGKTADAEAAYKKALKIDPSRSEAKHDLDALH